MSKHKISFKSLLPYSLIVILIAITLLSLLPPKSSINLGSQDKVSHFIAYFFLTLNALLISEKHIKSILVGEDGSTIKTIAFNSMENEIGAYLLKKDNKSFNIAGKLSLNEWRGQSNVEFIIDDISVNKTFKKTVPSSIG